VGVRTEVEAVGGVPAISANLRLRPALTVLETDAAEQRGASANGNGVSGQVPPGLSERFTFVRQLVPPDARHQVLLVNSISAGSQHVLKLVPNRHELSPDALVANSDAARVALIRPTEIGTLSTGSGYEVQPYIQGITLASWLARCAPLNASAARELLTALYACVDELRRVSKESGGVWVHCDVKPDNVLVLSERPLQLGLIDFGSTTFVVGPTARHHRGRTIAYSAPELAHGVAQPNSDLWSIGTIVYQAILGRHPVAPADVLLSESELEYSCRAQMANGWEPVGVSVEGSPSLGKAIEGLMTAAPSERWSFGDLQSYLTDDAAANQPRERKARIAEGKAKPFLVSGSSCVNVQQAALAMASNWNTGIEVMQDPMFHSWLEDDCSRADLADAARSSKGGDANLGLLRFAYWANPTMPPTWRGISLEKTDLLVLASNILLGIKSNQSSLREIREALQFLAGVRNGVVPNDECMRIARAWKDQENEYDQAFRAIVSAGAPASSIPDAEQLDALALLLACDVSRVEAIRKEIAAAFIDNVPRQGWLYAWGRDASSLTAAQVCVLRALLPASVASIAIGPIPSSAEIGRNDGGRVSGRGSHEGVNDPRLSGIVSHDVIAITYRFAFSKRLI